MSNDLQIFKKPEDYAVLKVLNGPLKNKQFRLLSSKIIIGRHNSCDIVLDSQSCSRKHASISYNKALGQYIIESLNLKNPVVVNKKNISKHQLREKDCITLGHTELIFSAQAKLPSVHHSAEHKQFQQQKRHSRQGDKSSYASRIILLAAIGLVAGMLFLDNETKKEQNKDKAQITKNMEEEIKVLKKINEEQAKDRFLLPSQKEARIAFIRGFRDYRKGYFLNALKTFEHCTTLYKNHELCKSYAKKSRTQLEKIIEKNMLLGKNYKENHQYSACEATFEKVLLLVRDTSRDIYQESLQNRVFCAGQLKNKI